MQRSRGPVPKQTLKEALATCTESGGGSRAVFDRAEAVAALREKYEVCAGLLHGFDRAAWAGGTPAERLALSPSAQEHVLALRDGRERLSQAARERARAFALAAPHEDAPAIRDDAAFFPAVASSLGEGRRARRVPKKSQAMRCAGSWRRAGRSTFSPRPG